jgi:hypothetical protein
MLDYPQSDTLIGVSELFPNRVKFRLQDEVVAKRRERIEVGYTEPP